MFRQMVLVTVFLNTFAEGNLQCLYCSEAVSPTDCDTVVRFGEHERCYVDAYVSPTGSLRYKLGCRDVNMCGTSPNVRKREVSFMTTHGNTHIASDSLMFSKVKRRLWTGTRTISSKRSNNLLICSECCTGNLCGSAGCGYKGYSTPRGPICFNCAEQLTPGDCSKIQQCDQGEVCMLLKTLNPISHEVRYKTECSTEKSCRNEIQKFNEIAALFVGKRRRRQYHLEIGDSCLVQCCTTDMCNVNCGNNTYFNSNATPGIVSSQTKHPAPTTSTQSSARISTEQGIMHTHVSASTYTQTTAIRSTYRTSQPVTPSTTLNYQTPKLPPTIDTGGCFINGVKYNLGEYWYHGCTEKCFCVNGSTGEFRCAPRCRKWDLPTECRLRPPEKGKCCPEPECPSNVLFQFPSNYVSN